MQPASEVLPTDEGLAVSAPQLPLPHTWLLAGAGPGQKSASTGLPL